MKSYIWANNDLPLLSSVYSVRIVDEFSIASCNANARICVDRFIEMEVFEVWQGLHYQEICTMEQAHWLH